MSSASDLESFIASSFRSVWALELLLLLKREDRPCSREELVALMRASPSVIENALEALVAAGLAGMENGEPRYMPTSHDIAALVDRTEQLYGSKPDYIRRLIVASPNRGLAAFSNAFRLKD